MSGLRSSTVRRVVSEVWGRVAFPAPDPFVRAAGKRCNPLSLQTLGDEKTCGERQYGISLWSWASGGPNVPEPPLGAMRVLLTGGAASRVYKRGCASSVVTRRFRWHGLVQAGGHRFDPGTLHSEKLCKRALSVF